MPSLHTSTDFRISTREFIYKSIPEMNRPLTCIFTALFSILIFGYLNSASSISYEFASGMYVIACAFYIFSLYKFISLRNIEFYPSFSAFTFPFVISALATKGMAGMIWQNSFMNGIAIIETVIAAALVIYVLIKYIKFLKK